MSWDPDKVNFIRKWLEILLINKTGVKSFLQIVQFCSTFMRPKKGRTYKDVTLLLRNSIRHNVRINLTKDHS